MKLMLISDVLLWLSKTKFKGYSVNLTPVKHKFGECVSVDELTEILGEKFVKAMDCQVFLSVDEEELTPKIYKERRGLICVEPYVDSMVLAKDKQGYIAIMAVLVDFSGIREPSNERWIVTNVLDGRTYMFQDVGLFGYTDNKEDRKRNSFATIKEAIDSFHSFYK